MLSLCLGTSAYTESGNTDLIEETKVAHSSDLDEILPVNTKLNFNYHA